MSEMIIQHSIADDGVVATLYLGGALDAVSSPEIQAVLNELVEKQRNVVVDLSALRMIDSSGVDALLSLYRRVRAHDDAVGFRGVTAQPLFIFKLLHLDATFGLTPNDRRPMAALPPGGAGI
jgi:anti-anti-sigma factor